MESVYISGNVLLALKTAVRMKCNAVTLGFSGTRIAIAVEDIIGSLAVFEDRESTHGTFVIRLPREIMAEVITSGFMQITHNSDGTSLNIKIYKERECINLIKNSRVPRSCSMDFNYLYEQINPDNLSKMELDTAVFSKSLLPLTEYTGQSLSISDGHLIIYGNGIMYTQKLKESSDMTLPAEVHKQLSKTINPNTIFFKSSNNTFSAQNGPMFTVWRSEYKNLKVDLETVYSAVPLAEYELRLPEIVNCGVSSTTIMKNAKIEINLENSVINSEMATFTSATTIKVVKISGQDIKSFSIPPNLFKLMSSSSTVKVYIFYKFIRIVYGEGMLDIGGTIRV